MQWPHVGRRAGAPGWHGGWRAEQYAVCKRFTRNTWDAAAPAIQELRACLLRCTVILT